MEAWDPWAALRARPDITLRWAHLPAGQHGTVHPDGAGWVITLDSGLDRIGRRCTLAHELIHVERGITHAPRATMVREEAIVRAETARRLVPLELLEAELAGITGFGEGVTARDVARFHDVTVPVAAEAVRLLGQRPAHRRAA